MCLDEKCVGTMHGGCSICYDPLSDYRTIVSSTLALALEQQVKQLALSCDVPIYCVRYMQGIYMFIN